MKNTAQSATFPTATIIEENDTYRYFDKNGRELREGDTVICENGERKTLYLTESGMLGFDATNPAWIKTGRAVPCEFGIYPLNRNDLAIIARESTVLDDYLYAIRTFLVIADTKAASDANHRMLDRGLITLDMFQAAARLIADAFLAGIPEGGTENEIRKHTVPPGVHAPVVLR